MKHRITLAAALAASGTATIAVPALAVPYASGLHNTSGSTWEFVLNESADNVKILRNGGSALDLGGLTAGRHTFSMAGFTSFDVEVSKNAPKAWTQISDQSNLFTRFEQPSGLAINKNASSPYFGTIYVANAKFAPTAAVDFTDPATPDIPARPMNEGIYSLTADMIGVDLTNFAVETDPLLESLAKAPGWEGLTDASTGDTRSPWRIGLDGAGNLIAADWSASGGGIKWASPDLSAGGLLLDKVGAEGGPEGVMNADGQYIHSNISSKPNISGTMGVDLTITAADNGMQAELGVAGSRANVWKWSLGSHDPATMGGFAGVPELVIQGNKLGGDKYWYTTVANVSSDVHYSPEHDLYYMTQPRANGTEASLVIVKAGVDGADPEVLFSSLDFSTTNALDGNIDAAYAGVNDIFRNAGTVELSPDGSKLYLRRSIVNASATNPVLGSASNNNEAVLAIPLDATGLPILTINDMGTPDDTSDDRLADLEGITVASPGTSARTHELEFDAAGNAYTTSNISERLQVFSPGGNTKAITSSNGNFIVEEFVVPALPGDFDGNQVVDGADFLLWQRGGSPTPLSAADFSLWKANFGTSAASPAVAAVPEPTSLVGALSAALFGLSAMRRRRVPGRKA